MIAGARAWLLSVLSVSLVCALADALMPDGGVKRVGRLVCGLALTAAVLSPAVHLDLEEGQRWLEQYLAGLERREAELRDQTGMKTIIEDSFAAYIVDKAAQLGLPPVSARVECLEEEGVCLPARLQVSGPLSPAERELLSRTLEAELGVPKSEQYYDEEETP